MYNRRSTYCRFLLPNDEWCVLKASVKMCGVGICLNIASRGCQLSTTVGGILQAMNLNNVTPCGAVETTYTLVLSDVI